jgi:hypothetical protein
LRALQHNECEPGKGCCGCMVVGAVTMAVTVSKYRG